MSRGEGLTAITRRDPTSRRKRERGQAIVEFALVAPLLLLLLLITIEFGQVFNGWLAVNNASRSGADYASRVPDAWALPDSPTKQGQRAAYAAAINASLGSQKCSLDAP